MALLPSVPGNISKHGMTEDQLATQWKESSKERKKEIIRQTLGRRASNELVNNLASSLYFHKLVEQLTMVETQVVVNRLCMDAGYLD
jgi:hypothetical protein